MRKIIAILLAFLLTGALLLFCMSFLGRQALMPAMTEQGAPVSDELIREEQQLIRERVTSLAELHGFQAEPVCAVSGYTLLVGLCQGLKKLRHGPAHII